MLPATMSQGAPMPESRSKPAIWQDSKAPLGNFQFRKKSVKLTAFETPGTCMAFQRLDSAMGEPPLTWGMPGAEIQRSAVLCSTMLAEVSRKPRNMPNWTAMRTRAKTMPVRVTTRRTRS